MAASVSKLPTPVIVSRDKKTEPEPIKQFVVQATTLRLVSKVVSSTVSQLSRSL